MKVFGKWTDSISCVRMQNGKATGEEKVVWRAAPDLPKSNQMYMFTEYALQLNIMTDGLKQVIPHTDSRHRTD